jgi:hypothetical protein
MTWKENINTIKEIYPGHFQIILDFATVKILNYVLSNDYKYVWVYDHETTESLEWGKYNLPIFSNKKYHSIMARQISFSYILPINDFREILPEVGPGITLAQVNQMPAHYLNPSTIKGKTRYDLLLKECDYLFEIDIPSATDYGTLISSNKNYLQSIIDNKEINWKDLP